MLVGRKFKNFNECVKSLLAAANFQDIFTKNINNQIEKLAFEDEKRKYQEYILSFTESNLSNTEIKRLPYSRRLNEYESKKIRGKLLEKWNFDRYYWYPLTDVSPDCALFLMKKYILPFEKEIIDIIKSISLSKYYEIGEGRNDYKCSIKFFTPLLYEEICCDDSFDWVVYGSHEDTIAFGGEILIPKIKELLKAYEDKFNLWE